MCVSFLAYNAHPKFTFILAHNRDEYYSRKSLQARFWDENQELLAGTDLMTGGTWLGITKQCRIALVTNVRKKKTQEIEKISRGMLVKNFLTSTIDAEDYLKNVITAKSNYADFNLILGNLTQSLYYCSSMHEKITKLKPGIYGLSNASLDTPWPKVTDGKTKFQKIIQQEKDFVDDLLTLMKNQTPWPDQALPDTGVGLEVERILSPIFVVTPNYGTHSTTIITLSTKGELTFVENSYLHNKDQPEIVSYSFKQEKI